MADAPAAPLKTPSDIGRNEASTVADALNAILADSFALYLKTKNFHWHVSGPHFRDYHLMLDDQATQILGHHRCDCRAGSQDRQHDAALDQRHRAPPAHLGQQRRLCDARGHAEGAARG